MYNRSSQLYTATFIREQWSTRSLDELYSDVVGLCWKSVNSKEKLVGNSVE